MKALLINVADQSVSTIELKHTKELYAHIGNGCHTFCAPVDFPNGDTLFADDEALLQDNLQGCFSLENWKYPIVGNAVILGCTDDGDVADCKSKPDDILCQIMWGNKEAAEIHRDNALSVPPTFVLWENE